jgi:opacity protein-like surface antigen
MKFPASCALLTCAALGIASAGPARAADMPFFSPPDAPIDVESELGTGWYLRGDVGYSNITSPQVIGDLIDATVRTGTASGSVGVGYQHNSWLRTEFALDRAVIRPNATGDAIWCAYSNHPLVSDPVYVITYDEQGRPVRTLVEDSKNLGYGVDRRETCLPRTTANLSRITGMFNAYLDLGNWFGLTPYVGAGVGASYVRSSGSISYYKTSDGTPYAADLSPVEGFPLQWIELDGTRIDPQPNIAFAQQYWDRNRAKSSWKFAWALMAGASYDVTDNLKLDIGYRFLNSGKYTGLQGFTGSTPKSYDLIAHEVRVGMRITTD